MSRRGTVSKFCGGFTIIEVMIFLAVSSMLLTSALLIFSGVNNRNQFSLAMRDIDSKFQDIINDTSTGFFDQSNYQCASQNNSAPTFNSGGGQQGTNAGCIFLGKAILLQPDGQPNVISIVPVVGNRSINGRDVASYGEAFPTTVYDSSQNINLSTTYEIRWGARVKSATPSFAGGFYGSLARLSSASSNIPEAGAQHLNQYQHNITVGGATQGTLKTCIQTLLCFGSSPTVSPWVICFESADSQQTAQLSVGGNGSLSTKLEFISC